MPLISRPIYSNDINSIKHWENVKACGRFNTTQINANFNCSNNKIKSMIGFPKTISGNFLCPHNKISSLDECPQHVFGRIDLTDNRLTSLYLIHERIKTIGDGVICLGSNEIKTNILGLLLIFGLKDIQGFGLSPAFNIVQYHLINGKDVLACQEDLILAGYKEFAKF